MYLLLSVIGLITALVLAWRFDLGVAQTAAAALPTLAPSYLAWAAFHTQRAKVEPLDEDKILEQLAVAVRTQWDNEAAVRRVNDPYPLPVAWESVGEGLAEDWPLLTGLARTWPGGPRATPPCGRRMPPGWRARMRRSDRSSPNGYPPGAWWSWANPAPGRAC
ncbi:hypothetical protein [Streptomyces sp. Rer75]|uniref:hypothetical protein n=1 Tax=Streptomyces sp. Rer75 TaxID=2750011 RepID=UPI0015CFC0DD|nr:hypothetical protein [Streptomyces sp. Rer75]QLH26652.1 hypothetical protein HYQ63_43540 [Streptomyces sp. Rer75]